MISYTATAGTRRAVEVGAGSTAAQGSTALQEQQEKRAEPEVWVRLVQRAKKEVTALLVPQGLWAPRGQQAQMALTLVPLPSMAWPEKTLSPKRSSTYC